MIDEFAERVRMIEEAVANPICVIKDMRDSARAADDHNDPGTVDLSKMVQVHGKHEWFLREPQERRNLTR